MDFQTTFMIDFRIADKFGNAAIKDTFNRAFNEWKGNIKYVTELCVVMNMLCWYWYDKGNDTRSQIYGDYYYKVRDYVYDNYSGEDTEYFFNMTD